MLVRQRVGSEISNIENAHEVSNAAWRQQRLQSLETVAVGPVGAMPLWSYGNVVLVAF